MALACYRGLENNRGDFYATLPGAYVATWNPTLWNSSDLQDASGFQRAEYLYGPTQYFTIFPLIFLDSYEAIATVLLALYLFLIGLSAWFMWKAVRLPGAPAHARSAVIASTFMFLPLLQAYVQREFEVVILFLTTWAFYSFLSHREGLAGALIGYATWFKFLPLAFLPYFVIRGRVRAVVGFVLMSAVVLALTATLLDLSRFGPIVELALSQSRLSIGDGPFCEVWSQPETRHHAVANSTRASIKWALCSFEDRWRWLPARWTYAGTVALIIGIIAVGFWRLQRNGPLHERDERWRRSLEVSLVLMAPWLVYAHYYYLSLAIVPLNVLLVRYLADIVDGHSCKRLWMWGAAYTLLSAFVVPPSVMSQLVADNFWRFYMRNNVYFFGEVLLLALLLWEYLMLAELRPGRARRPLLIGRHKRALSPWRDRPERQRRCGTIQTNCASLARGSSRRVSVRRVTLDRGGCQMRRLIALTTLGLSLGAACAPSVPARLSEADLAQIRHRLDEMARHVSAEDNAAWAQDYTEDGVFMIGNSPAIRGRVAIEQWGEAGPRVTAMAFSDVEIRGGGEWAWATTSYSLTLEGLSEPDTGKQLIVLQRQPDGSWLAAAASVSSDLPPSPAS